MSCRCLRSFLPCRYQALASSGAWPHPICVTGNPIYIFGGPVDQQSGDRIGRLQPMADGQYATLCLCLYVPLRQSSYNVDSLFSVDEMNRYDIE